MAGAMTEQEVYEYLHLAEVSEVRLKDICFQRCSAKNGDGVWEGIAKLGDVITNAASASANKSGSKPTPSAP